MNVKYKTGTLLMSCALMVMMSGCGNSEEKKTGETLKAVNKNDYASYLPYQSSDANQKHATTSTDLTDTFTIGNGLMNLSKEYFSPDTYTFREGEYLDFDTLDANNSTGLLGRYKKSNTMGLNPEIGASFTIEGGGELAISETDVLLLDIYEYDWYDGDELKGLSLGFVLNDKIGATLTPSTVSKEKLEAYATEVARKTVNYLRKKVPEIGKNLPVYVALYNTESGDETLPGTFFKDAYFKTNINGTFEDIKEQWVLFPTSTASTLDGTTGTSFTRFKDAFKDVMPYDVAITGKGHYMENTIDSLIISVNLRARSSGEVKTAIQLLNDKLSLFATGYEITVDISSDNIHAAVIKREKGSSSTSVITLL